MGYRRTSRRSKHSWFSFAFPTLLFPYGDLFVGGIHMEPTAQYTRDLQCDLGKSMIHYQQIKNPELPSIWIANYEITRHLVVLMHLASFQKIYSFRMSSVVNDVIILPLNGGWRHNRSSSSSPRVSIKYLERTSLQRHLNQMIWMHGSSLWWKGTEVSVKEKVNTVVLIWNLFTS